MAETILLISPELPDSGGDEARLQHVLGRRRNRQVAELHVEVGGELLDGRIEPAADAPDLFGIEIAHHGFEKGQVEIGKPLVQDRSRIVGIFHDVARATNAAFGQGLERCCHVRLVEGLGAYHAPDVAEPGELDGQSREHGDLILLHALERGDGVDERRVGAPADHSLQARGVPADLDETRARFVDTMLAHDEARELIGQSAGTGRGKGLADEVLELRAFAGRKHEAVVADRLPGMNGADARAGVDGREYVERSDHADVGISGEQHPHGVGIAGDVEILDFESIEPSLFQRHQKGQRVGRYRPG